MSGAACRCIRHRPPLRGSEEELPCTDSSLGSIAGSNFPSHSRRNPQCHFRSSPQKPHMLQHQPGWSESQPREQRALQEELKSSPFPLLAKVRNAGFGSNEPPRLRCPRAKCSSRTGGNDALSTTEYYSECQVDGRVRCRSLGRAAARCRPSKKLSAVRTQLSAASRLRALET